jgi:hypothetical protein
MLLTDLVLSVSVVGELDLSPENVLKRNRVTTPTAAVFLAVHTPYDYDQRI